MPSTQAHQTTIQREVQRSDKELSFKNTGQTGLQRERGNQKGYRRKDKGRNTEPKKRLSIIYEHYYYAYTLEHCLWQ